MRSDFAAARRHLEIAQQKLHGGDPASRKLQEAIDLLVELALTAEHMPRRGEVLVFPRKMPNAQ